MTSPNPQTHPDPSTRALAPTALGTRVGMMQGLRTMRYALIPMVIGPFIGAAMIRGADEYYEEFGLLKQVPTPGIFVAAAAASLLIVIPVRALRRTRG